MLEPVREAYFKSVEDLFGSDHMIRSAIFNELIYGKYANFEKAFKENRFLTSLEIERLEREGRYTKIAYLGACEFDRNILKLRFADGTHKNSYQIPEVVVRFRKNLFVPNSHPGIENFQVINS